jgi:hypothetical protein
MDQAQNFSISNIKSTKMNPNTKIIMSNGDNIYVSEKIEDIFYGFSPNSFTMLTKITTRTVYGRPDSQKITKIAINTSFIITIESLTEKS